MQRASIGYYRRLQILLLIMCVVGCSAKPIYVAPVDPYETRVLDYYENESIIRTAIKKLNSRTPIKSEELTKIRLVSISCYQLGQQGHIPSAFLYDTYVLMQLNILLEDIHNTKTRSKTLARLSKDFKSPAKQIEPWLKEQYSLVMKDIILIARTGYPPARRFLEAESIPPPPIDIKTRVELKAEEEFQQQQDSYDEEKAKVANIIAYDVLIPIINAYTDYNNERIEYLHDHPPVPP